MRRGALALAATAALLFAGEAQGATIKVGTTNDVAGAGKCSLRDAVSAANANAKVGACPKGNVSKRDTIVLKGKTYGLSIPSSNENLNADGDLDVQSGGPLTIKGVGASKTAITQGVSDRVIELSGSGSDLKLSNLTVAGGDATTLAAGSRFGGNLRLTGSAGRLILDRVTVVDGEASVGGGVYAANDSFVFIKRSKLLDNTSESSGGALATVNQTDTQISRALFKGNRAISAGDSVQGGAIAHSAADGSMVISDTTFDDNAASASMPGDFAVGGAIRSSGPLDVKSSTFFENGVISTSTAGEYGGAVYVTGFTTDITNSTFAGNVAGDTVGGGGAVYAGSGIVTIEFSTFFENTAPGGDGDILAATSSGLITFARSAFDDPAPGFSCDGPVASDGFNVWWSIDPPCNTNTDDEVGVGSAVGLDAGGLANNGGPTRTISLTSGSVARNFIEKSECGPANGRDQRGYKRPAGSRCDAGAFERDAKKPKK